MPTHSLYLTTNIPTTIPAVPNISCIGADTSIIMTFSANSDGGSPVTSYQYSTDNFIADINTISIDSSPYTINNLTDGTSYNIELRAVNKNGVGPKTNSPDITPGNIPSKPTINNISVGNASATISFTTPSDIGGSIINYYILTYSNDDFVNSTTISNITTNPFTIESGLINGTTYKFKIRANNNFGDGIFSDDYSILMRPSATGGTELTNNGYKYHIFTNTTGTNSINFTQGGNIQYLIVAGGGAGGSGHGGGGGAGEVVSGSTNASANVSYTINVGAGGLTTATNGGSSSIVFPITKTAAGGGRGGGSNGTGNASNGGSGGGGSGYNLPTAATTTPGNSVKTGGGLGNAGGAGNQTTTAGGGGGGGGAGDVGGPGEVNSSGTAFGGMNGPGTPAYSEWILAIAGQMGTTWSSKTISGGVGYIASGGAGGSWAKSSVVTASVGGGGDGGVNNSATIQALPGTANTGGGGGGGGSGASTSTYSFGANGGSGLVVIRYLYL